MRDQLHNVDALSLRSVLLVSIEYGGLRASLADLENTKFSFPCQELNRSPLVMQPIAY